MILELEALMAEVAPGEPWSYRWLPASAVCAAACLACACVLRPGGKLKDALKYLERGQCYIENELHAQRIDIQVRTWKIPQFYLGCCSAVSALSAYEQGRERGLQYIPNLL